MSAAHIAAISREDQVIIGQQEEGYSGYSGLLAQSMKKRREEEPTLTELIRDAKEKADAQRERFKLANAAPRYGDAPLEAYARISRAHTPLQAGAAAGYARRRLVQMEAARRSDPDHAEQIRAAAGQLRKAVSRANKKKLELNQEELARARQKRMARENRRREEQRVKQELRRSQSMRSLRESSYFRETEIANRMADQLTATRMELKAQAEQLGVAAPKSIDAAVQGYSSAAETAQIADAPVSVPQVDVQA